jgi:hypothetical protein
VSPSLMYLRHCQVCGLLVEAYCYLSLPKTVTPTCARMSLLLMKVIE